MMNPESKSCFVAMRNYQLKIITGLPWVWESPYGYPYGDPHRGKSYSYSQPISMSMGIPTEILWEWKFPSHGNPGF